jgi:hypothetical protein
LSVDQTDRVDAIGIDTGTGDLVLTISDHLPWDDDAHLYLLQEKLNTYFAFVESDELLEAYPDAKGRRVVMEVVCQYPLDVNARTFFETARAAISSTGFELRFKTL